MNLTKRESLIGDVNKDFWCEILEAVRKETKEKKDLNDFRLIVLGDRTCGKTNLISRVSPHSKFDSKPGAGLQFFPLEVYESVETKDSVGTINTWILDGDSSFNYLLEYAITKQTIMSNKLIILIIIDLSTPWYIMDSIKNWLRIIENFMDSLQFTPKELQNMKDDYIEKYFSSENPGEIKSMASRASENFGFPIVIIGNKTDTFPQLEMNHNITGDVLDLIQVHLRNACLEYGAALVYCNNKNQNSHSLLYDYITSLFFDFEFTESPNVIDHDSIFIPIGWDSQRKITVLKENITSISSEDPLQVHIHVPFEYSSTYQSPTQVLETNDFYIELEKKLISENQNLSIQNNTNRSSCQKSKTNQSSKHESSRLEDILDTTDSTITDFSLNISESTRSLSTNLRPTENSGEFANFFSTLLNSKRSGGSKKP